MSSMSNVCGFVGDPTEDDRKLAPRALKPPPPLLADEDAPPTDDAAPLAALPLAPVTSDRAMGLARMVWVTGMGESREAEAVE